MVEYKRGVENVPLRQVIDTLPALIIVYDLRNGDTPIVENRIDFSNPADRQWLGRISAWALKNHCSVETMAICDAEAEQIKPKENV